MAGPALVALRERFPAAELVLRGKPHLAGLVELLPAGDRFLAEPRGRGGIRGVWAQARALRAERLDLAVLLPDSVRAALAPALARIPQRIGYARDLLRRALVTRALDVPREDGRRVPIPMPERYVALVRALGFAGPTPRVSLHLPEALAQRAHELLAARGLAARPFALVSPGAAFGSSKLWPAEHFAKACDGLRLDLGLEVVLAPGPGEEPLARAIASAMAAPPVLFDAPVTSLPELAALTARAALVLCNDTGPRHLAAALDRPAVVLMGPTDPRHTAYPARAQVVLREPVACSPCHEKVCPIDHRCLRRIGPERVIAAARELL
jgi:heptosyltransferase-2